MNSTSNTFRSVQPPSQRQVSDTVSNKTSSVIGNSQVSHQIGNKMPGKQLNAVEELKFEEIVLESNEIDFEELQKQPNFKETNFQSSLYVGQIVDGRRNGKGVMKYSNGR